MHNKYGKRLVILNDDSNDNVFKFKEDAEKMGMNQTDYFDYVYEFYESHKYEFEKLEKEYIFLKESLDILQYALDKILKE